MVKIVHNLSTYQINVPYDDSTNIFHSNCTCLLQYGPICNWSNNSRFSIKNLGYVGLRSVDKYERLAIEKYEVPAFAMEDVEK